MTTEPFISKGDKKCWFADDFQRQCDDEVGSRPRSETPEACMEECLNHPECFRAHWHSGGWRFWNSSIDPSPICFMFPVGSAPMFGKECSRYHQGSKMIQCTPYECAPEPDSCKHGKAGAYCDLEEESSEKYVCKSCEDMYYPSDCNNVTLQASNPFEIFSTCLFDCFNMQHCNHAFTDCSCADGHSLTYYTTISPGEKVFSCEKTYSTSTKTTSTTTTPTTTTTVTTQVKLDWCNLTDYKVEFQHRLNSSKQIIVLDEIDDKTFDDAKRVCDTICGDLYFPSSQKENDDLQSFLKDRPNGSRNINWLWLRIIYDETAEEWKDIDNKENLTFTNFLSYYSKNSDENHAVMTRSGGWVYESKTYDTHSPYVLCELS